MAWNSMGLLRGIFHYQGKPCEEKDQAVPNSV